MIDNMDEFTGQLLQLLEGHELSTLLVALAFGLTLIVGLVLREFHARALRRLHAAAAAYAERELTQQRPDHAARLGTSGATC